MFRRIVSPKGEIESASKALKLNGGTDYEPRLFTASSTMPTIRIKRLSSSDPGIKLKGASSIQNQLKLEKVKAEKALLLNGLV